MQTPESLRNAIRREINLGSGAGVHLTAIEPVLAKMDGSELTTFLKIIEAAVERGGAAVESRMRRHGHLPRR